MIKFFEMPLRKTCKKKAFTFLRTYKSGHTVHLRPCCSLFRKLLYRVCFRSWGSVYTFCSSSAFRIWMFQCKFFSWGVPPFLFTLIIYHAFINLSSGFLIFLKIFFGIFLNFFIFFEKTSWHLGWTYAIIFRNANPRFG